MDEISFYIFNNYNYSNTTETESIYNDNENKNFYAFLVALPFCIVGICRFIICRQSGSESQERIRDEMNHKMLRENKILVYECNKNLIFRDCTICIESFKQDDIVCKLSCEHLFHKECISKWLKKSNSCPNCRLAAL